MPCTDGGPSYDEYTKCRLDEVTELLCLLCHAIEVTNNQSVFPKPVARWWKEHKKRDAERIAVEEAQEERKKLVKLARSKLTKKELEALGL